MFRLVPGLENQFVRHGAMHRNTYINAPGCSTKRCSSKRAIRCSARAAAGLEGSQGISWGVACGSECGAGAGGRRHVKAAPATMAGALIVITQADQGLPAMKGEFRAVAPLEGAHRKTSARRACSPRWRDGGWITALDALQDHRNKAVLPIPEHGHREGLPHPVLGSR